MKKPFLFLSLISMAIGLHAQKNIIDEVIWIVGDEAILRSEVEEQRIRANLTKISLLDQGLGFRLDR